MRNLQAGAIFKNMPFGKKMRLKIAISTLRSAQCTMGNGKIVFYFWIKLFYSAQVPVRGCLKCGVLTRIASVNTDRSYTEYKI